MSTILESALTPEQRAQATAEDVRTGNATPAQVRAFDAYAAVRAAYRAKRPTVAISADDDENECRVIVEDVTRLMAMAQDMLDDPHCSLLAVRSLFSEAAGHLADD